MIKVAVLMTCFNRREKTIRCLSAIHENTKIKEVELDIYLVNDGCTDGTVDEVMKQYPAVNVIQGTGSLYWNGGMRLAWRAALNKEYDFYLWVNDDSIMEPDAIARIIIAYNVLKSNGENVGAILGTMVDSLGSLTYGGRLRNSKINPISFGPVLKPSDESIICHFINGNFTLIPENSVKKIGILSDAYTHSMGDFDYGLRLKKLGLNCWVAPGVYGECETNSLVGGCQDAELSVIERASKMQSISQLPPVNEWMYFVRKHGGSVWPLLWIKAWIRGKFPFLWVVLRGKKE
jgi:GT2 family glycosyltransferase